MFAHFHANAGMLIVMSKKTEPLVTHLLGREVNLAAHAMRGMLDAGLEKANTSFATWRVLQALSAEDHVIQRELAQSLEIEGPTLVRRLDQLELENLVTRKASANDRRATVISLTQKGRSLFLKLRSAMAEMESTLLSGLSADDVETTLRVLRHLIERSRAEKTNL
jgi:MarR family transcriptional regulator, transcriptional regulator for hemolysin